MTRIRNAIISALVLLLGRGRRRPTRDETRIVPAQPDHLAAELAVLALLGISSFCAIAFILIYAFGKSIPNETQFLGAALGFSLLFLATALIVVGLKLVPSEEVAEEYPPHEHPYEQQVIAEVIDESGTRFTRSRFFKLGLLGAGGTRRRGAVDAGSSTRTASLTRRRTSRRRTSTSPSPRGRTTRRRSRWRPRSS